VFTINNSDVYNNFKENTLSATPTMRSLEIRRYLLRQIPSHPFDAIIVTAKHFGLSRQAISRHMRALIEDGSVNAEGHTKSRRYTLTLKTVSEWRAPLLGLKEDFVWRERVLPLFTNHPDNIKDIWEYGFTEMLNNAIDHSGGQEVSIEIMSSPISHIIMIADDGIGIFRKIKNACSLDDERHAVLELAKGKFTTDPENHTGEGIFFTSRCFDLFNIFSGVVYFNHDERINDEHWIFETERPSKGTTVILELTNDSDRQLEDIFEQFASEDGDYAFNKTVVPVNLLRHGKENIVSRSQAKRLMARVEIFKTVVLDFHEIDKVGQAFADEIFRVFVNRHPHVNIVPVRANINVKRMIRRARAVVNNK
jgi:DNA-binding transcriptional ArsR family regulator